MYLMPLFATFLNTIVALLGRHLGHRGVVVFSITALVAAFLSSAFIWFDLYIGGSPVSIELIGSWFSVGTVNASWFFYFDLLTAHMLFTVTSVSLAVHIFTVVYMRHDPHLSLFLGYLSLFTFFMLVYVCADNLLVMLIGWEGIGICSYLLIGYYSHRLAAIKSAQKAIVVNRISDGMLLWGILWIWFYCGTLEYDLIILNSTTHFSLFIILPIFIGAMGKSAQIFFHVWLADAMEGPTPVSALIHAATLVTAGIYLMIRFAPFIAGSDFITLVGCCTAFMAALFAFFQSDLKRVIAFSTCSQLGYMMVSVSLGEFGADASIAHLMSHASFKAALFLAAGVIILATGGQQNLSRFGGLSNAHSSIFCLLTLFFASLALVAFPETSGFYTKEVILNLSYSFVNAGSFASTYYAHTLLSITAFLTATYSAKLFYLCFLYDYSGSLLVSSTRSSTLLAPRTPFEAHSYKKHGSTNILLIVAMSLLIFDIVFKIWVGTNLIDGILFFVPWVVKTLPFALVIAGFLSATAFASANNNFLFIIRFTATRWGFDQLYARSFVNMVLDWGRISWAAADKGLFLVPSIKLY